MRIYVKANAKKLSDIKDDVEEKIPALVEAFAQLYLFHGTEYVNHWRVEVWNKIPRVPMVKRRNKLPRKEDLFDAMWRTYGKESCKFMDWAVAHEENLTPDYNRLKYGKEEFAAIVKDYLTWLSEQLSKNTVIDPNDVYRKLVELGL